MHFIFISHPAAMKIEGGRLPLIFSPYGQGLLKFKVPYLNVYK